MFYKKMVIKKHKKFRTPGPPSLLHKLLTLQEVGLGD